MLVVPDYNEQSRGMRSEQVDLVDPELVRTYTTIALVLFVALVSIASARMIWRLVSFWKEGVKTPYLLKRDILFFGTFATYFGLVLIFRLMGFVLTQNPIWIIPTTTVVLIATAYWVWVEFHID